MPIQITYDGEEDGVLQTQISQCFDALDKQFSTYKDSSDVSLFSRGELPTIKQDAVFREVFSACEFWNKQTTGAFDAHYNGAYDPSGYVKAMAIKQAQKLLELSDIERYIINASGDVLTASTSEPWNVALQHPITKGTTIARLQVYNLAIATSGSYERGNHIVNPQTTLPAQKLLSMTVIGNDIIQADVLATAAFAIEDKWESLINQHDGYEALAISANGTIHMSSGFAKLVA